jgi:ketosteroid isomerase-like protein
MPEMINGAEADAHAGTPTAALVDFYAAFNQRDLSRMTQNWWQSASASMSNPLGGIRRGWHEIEMVYRKIFNGPARVYVEYYDFNIVETGHMFCAVGRERGWVSKDDVKLALAIRTTRIFQRVESRWQQVHHHGSIDDPALLQAYQAAVLSDQGQ